MKKIILTIKDDTKTDFLIRLLEEFDFIEIKQSGKKVDEAYDFFSSAGMWKDREIDAKELRKQAWKRSH
jgi:hypothetical protein